MLVEHMVYLTVISWCIGHAVFRMHLAKWYAERLDERVSDQDVKHLWSDARDILEYMKMLSARAHDRSVTIEAIERAQLNNQKATARRKRIRNKYAWFRFVGTLLSCRFCHGVWSGALVAVVVHMATGDPYGFVVVATSAMASHLIPAGVVKTRKFPAFGAACPGCNRSTQDSGRLHREDLAREQALSARGSE